MVKMLKGMLINQMRLVRDRILLERIAARYEAQIDPRAIIRIKKLRSKKHSRLSFGKHVVIGAYTLIDIEPESVTGSERDAVLEVGDYTYFGEFNNIRVTGLVRIGAKCLISQGVSIIGSNHSFEPGVPMQHQPQRKDKVGVTIGDDVWIGTHSTILPGVTVGSGSVVGAGSVVTADVPCNVIVAGVPAKIIKVRA